MVGSGPGVSLGITLTSMGNYSRCVCVVHVRLLGVVVISPDHM